MKEDWPSRKDQSNNRLIKISTSTLYKPFSLLAGQRRLDKLQATGLDLVVTELDILWPDVVQRADIFEDVVRTYFAHPGVSGLFLWGFCDRHMREPAGMELVHGDDLQVRLGSGRVTCTGCGYTCVGMGGSVEGRGSLHT